MIQIIHHPWFLKLLVKIIDHPTTKEIQTAKGTLPTRVIPVAKEILITKEIPMTRKLPTRVTLVAREVLKGIIIKII